MSSTGHPDAGARPPLVSPTRLLRRAAAALGVIALVWFACARAASPLRNSDTFFHLRFGQEFLDGWSPGSPGALGTTGTADWVPTQWLSQVAWALTHEIGGAGGLAVLYAVLVAAYGCATYLMLRPHTDPPYAAILTFFVVLGSAVWLGLRPQLVSFICTVLVVASWHHVRRSGGLAWWLVPLTWVWAMCHGMWIVGVAISAVAAVGLVLEEGFRRRRSYRHLVVPAAMLVAACLTPVGPRLLTGVVEVGSRGDHFAEWAPVPLLSGWGLVLSALIAATLVVLLRRGPVEPFPLLLLGLAIAFALYSGRTVVAALLLAAPLLAAGWRAAGTVRRPVTGREVAVTIALGAVPVLFVLLPSVDTRAGLDEEIEPFDARLDALADGSTVLTERPWGAVLLWTHPELEIPVHGYGDVFTDDELERMDDIGALEPGWDTTVAELAPAAALLEEQDRLAYALQGDGWTVAQSDDDLVLLVPPAGDS